MAYDEITWVEIGTPPDTPVSAANLNQMETNLKESLAGTGGAPKIQTLALDTGIVTGAKIGAAAVTAAKIGSGAVIEDRIGALAVTGSKIAADAITAPKIAPALSAVMPTLVDSRLIAATDTWPQTDTCALDDADSPIVKARWRAKRGADYSRWMDPVGFSHYYNSPFAAQAQLEIAYVHDSDVVTMYFTPISTLVGSTWARVPFSDVYDIYFYLPNEAGTVQSTWESIEVEWMVFAVGQI